ncbi:diguanylate cyclase domain-containing protein [Rhizobium tropici]|nr:diguanylate cyclase [Rhizobium tropici]
MAVTASIGVVVGIGAEDIEAVMARADNALYRAKHGGRNQVAARCSGEARTQYMSRGNRLNRETQ